MNQIKQTKTIEMYAFGAQKNHLIEYPQNMFTSINETLLLGLTIVYVFIIIEQRHEISNNVVCAACAMCSLIRAFASRLNIL